MRNPPLSLWSMIRNYKFRSVFTKNLLIFLILIQLPIVGLSLGFYKLNTQSVMEEVSSTHLSSLSRLRDMLDIMIQDVEDFALRMATDEAFTYMLEEQVVYPPDYNSSMKIESLFKKLNLSSLSRSFVVSIYLYSEHNQLILSSTNGLWPASQFVDISWLDNYMKNKAQHKEWALARRSVLYPSEKLEHQLITMIRTVPLFQNSKNGSIVINIDADLFGRMINNVSSNYVDNIFILDSTGTVLYNEDYSLINQNFSTIIPDEELTASKQQEPTFLYRNNSAESVSYISSQYNNWRYISILPLQLYKEKESNLLRFLIFSILGGVVVSLLLALFLSWKMFMPIKQIMSVVTHPENWQPDDHKKVRLDEIKYITTNILSAYDKKLELEQELTQRLALLNKAYTIALQSQINPHFMHNTLESINWQALRLTGGDNPVSEMIYSFSKLLRFALESDDSLVALSAEIENCKHYLDIQQFRFPGKFTVEWNIDPVINQFKIPRLTLQPLLENAIEHGLRPKKEHGVIRVTGTLDARTVLLQVSDNGIGISLEQATKINLDLQEKYNLISQHIGIKNANQRIKLIFGEQYGLSLASSPNGTMITVTLPAGTI